MSDAFRIKKGHPEMALNKKLGTEKVEPRGVEPLTPGLQSQCSPIELRPLEEC